MLRHLRRHIAFLVVMGALLAAALAVCGSLAIASAKSSAQRDIDAELKRLGGTATFREIRFGRHHGVTLVFDLHGTPELSLAIWRWLPSGKVILSK